MYTQPMYGDKKLFREFATQVVGEVYVTGIVFTSENPRKYLLVRHLKPPAQYVNERGIELWTVPGGHLTDRDVVRMPRISQSQSVLNTVEKIIQAHLTMTIGVDVTDVEFLLDPTMRSFDGIPIMGYYARYLRGYADARFGYEHVWATHDEAKEGEVDPIALREIKTLDNIFRERAMYDQLETELGKVEELLQTVQHISDK